MSLELNLNRFHSAFFTVDFEQGNNGWGKSNFLLLVFSGKAAFEISENALQKFVMEFTIIEIAGYRVTSSLK